MQTCTSSNLQTPSSKEIPESKHQKPSSKHQRSSKLQVPSSKRRPRFGAWNLGFLWCFELARTFHTGAVFCGKRCHDAAAASGVAQICNLPYRRFSIGRVFSVAPHPGHCRRPAGYNSAIQQIENLRYEYEISRLRHPDLPWIETSPFPAPPRQSRSRNINGLRGRPVRDGLRKIPLREDSYR